MMQSINLTRLVLAVAAIAVVATAGFLGTRAFFSDTETSVGNVFAAGSLDLMVGITGAGDDNDFAPQSIPGNQSLFVFNNLIPGDSDTGYFRLESSQDAWACLAADLTADYENVRLDAEQDAGDNTAGTGPNGGELSQYMEIAIWEANNNNTDGVVGTAENDTLRVMSLEDFANTEYHALQDSATGDNPLLAGGEEQYEFAYCFGEFTNVQDVTDNGGTLECDGSSAGNDSQTDSTEMTIHFYAEQMQNNDNFVCSGLNPAPEWTATTQTGGEANVIDDGDAVVGDSVLEIVTIDDNDSRVRYTRDFDLDLDTLTSISFDSKQVDVVSYRPDLANASMRLHIDLDGDTGTTGDVQEVVYEPYYNYNAENSANSQSSVIANTWQTWNATLTEGKFWANGGFLGATPNGGAYATNFTMQDVLTAHPDAKIVGMSLGLGTWNPGWTIHVDNLLVNGTTYGFEN